MAISNSMRRVWLGVSLSVAAVLEIIAYYVPGVDNVLDVVAAPAALIAGTVVSAAVMTVIKHRKPTRCESLADLRASIRMESPAGIATARRSRSTEQRIERQRQQRYRPALEPRD